MKIRVAFTQSRPVGIAGVGRVIETAARDQARSRRERSWLTVDLTGSIGVDDDAERELGSAAGRLRGRRQ